MDGGVLERLIENCSTGFDSVEFCWHGSEPLLAGMDFYREAVRAEHCGRSNGSVTYRNTIQTNGTLLDSEWLKFFAENNFHIGISFDAPPDIHTRHRGLDPNQCVALWPELRRFNLPVGILCVVS